jgi:hypothetical protein
MATRTVLVFSLLVSFVGRATVEGSAILYGTNRSGTLFTIDTTTGVGTFVGSLPGSSLGGLITEIEFDNLSGRAWATGSAIQEFDLATAAGLGVPAPTLDRFSGLEFVGSTLYATDDRGASGLYSLDPTTGASTLIGFTGIGPVSGLAYDGATMYGIVGSGPVDSLYTIDLTTGIASLVGPTGLFNAGSLEFGPDGRLYAGDLSAVHVIDPLTGASTLVGTTGFGKATGLMLVQQVPEPNTFILLSLGVIGLLGAYRTRKPRH